MELANPLWTQITPDLCDGIWQSKERC